MISHSHDKANWIMSKESHYITASSLSGGGRYHRFKTTTVSYWVSYVTAPYGTCKENTSLIVTNISLFLQILITAISLPFSSSIPVVLIPTQRQPFLEIYCQFGYSFITSCVYNALIIIACCVYAFRARKVPSNFNESKFIGISVYSTLVVCLAAVPVYSTAVNVIQMFATLCVVLLLNSYLTVAFINLPKLYAIHFAGDNLAIESWRTGSESRRSVYSISMQPTQSSKVTNE